MSPWLMAAMGLLNYLGGQSASDQADEANKIAKKQVKTQNQLIKYLLEKRKTLYDPIEEKELLPRLTERVQTEPWYAKPWLDHAAALRQPMTLD